MTARETDIIAVKDNKLSMNMTSASQSRQLANMDEGAHVRCQMSRLVGKPTMWFPNRSDTNQPVQAQERARSLKFRIYVEEELYYPSSENKGADQLRGYREADLRLCFSPMQIVGFPMWRLKCLHCAPD